MRTQVGIVGAGPAGLLLGQLLTLQGIETVILERRDRTHVEGRIRAGVLEQGTVSLLRSAGVGERLDREGLIHDGIEIAVEGVRHRIDLKTLTGRSVSIYGQTEVTRDLIEARLGTGAPLLFEAKAVALQGIDRRRPVISFVRNGRREDLACDFIAGCDGFHGVCRQSLAPGAATIFERIYPFAWLGILADTPPVADELIYAYHLEGFALFSMRSKRRTRAYLQCRPDENLNEWPDERIWTALKHRLGDKTASALAAAPAIEKSITLMRSFVVEPMRFGQMFLAGDAAHIVPPTGAKGLNLAAADAHYLAQALIAHYKEKRDDLLENYSTTCLRRVWKAQRFSSWMTLLLHKVPGQNAFDQRLQRAEIDHLANSNAAAAALAENYVGLPLQP